MARQKRRRRGVWKGPHLRDVNWRGQDLQGQCFTAHGLHHAVLTDANLARCEMRGAGLAWADLTRCDLTGADLYEADLRGANLSEATLAGVNLRDAIYNEGTRWPSGFDPRSHGAVLVNDPVTEYSGCRGLLVVEIASCVLGLTAGYWIGWRRQLALDWMISTVLLGAVIALVLGLIGYVTVAIVIAGLRQPYLE